MPGRLIGVTEPLLDPNDLIAGFEYDENGNRSLLTYYLDGSDSGPATTIDYTYNNDNMLTKFETTGGSTFEFGKYNAQQELENAEVDGLGRLTSADESISNASENVVDFSYSFDYDMRSQLKQADIDKFSSSFWKIDYSYRKDGNLESKTLNDTSTTFTYDGDLMESASGGDNFALTWDDNGNLTLTNDTTLEYNWDNKLRNGEKEGAYSIDIKYDPDGNRIFKQFHETARKYIVDIVGDLPVILMELDPQDYMNIKKTYIYANGQLLCQHDGNDTDPRYFYMHDRLGSARQVINNSGSVVKYYTYKPFGEVLESNQDMFSASNSFLFTGQYYDSEIDEYYLRARQYDPVFGRFTSSPTNWAQNTTVLCSDLSFSGV